MIAALLLLLAGSAPTLVASPSGQPVEAAWLAEVVADGLPRALRELGVPVIDNDDRVRAHDSLSIPARSLTRATTVRIAEALGAARIVVGDFSLEHERLRLALRILDVERGTLSVPLLASGPVEQLEPVLRGLAWDIAVAASAPPPVSREGFVRASPATPFEALRLRGSALAAPDTATRVRLLKQALVVFPGYDVARLSLGRIQVEARESAAAAELLARIPDTSPEIRGARFLRGLACLELGRYQDAAALFAALLEPEPSAALLNNYALALLRGGKTPEGIRASDVLRRALDVEPPARETALNLGWALFVEGDVDAAAFWLRGVVKEDPSDQAARLALHWALSAAGRREEADEAWKADLATNPALAEHGTPDLGRKIERAVAFERPLLFDEERWGDRQYAASHLGRAEKAEEAGDLETARRELTQAAYLDPYSQRAHLRLARLEGRAGNAERAAAELRMALWVRDDPALRLELARLLADAGRTAEARAEAQRILKSDPTNAEARALAAKK